MSDIPEKAVKAAADAIRSECAMSPEDPDFFAAAVLALAAALPHLASAQPQPNDDVWWWMRAFGHAADAIAALRAVRSQRRAENERVNRRSI